MMLQNARALFIATALCLAAAAPGYCYADAKAGEALAKKGAGSAAPCMQCHGANGEGQAAAGFPRLAGQNQAYLVKQMQDFSTGRRSNPIMQAFARTLSAQQIRDVAEYYASLPAWQASKPVALTAAAARGSQLARKGNWDKGIPACFACHGEQGTGIAPSFPALAGQNANYMSKQLSAWRAGARTNDPQGLMRSVAEKMSPDEIAAVSAYFENPQ
ncbi:MAG: c-type cytochrome [Burkholderiales bacterium]